MAKIYDKDPCGAILEFCYLTHLNNQEQRVKQEEWIHANVKNSNRHLWTETVQKQVIEGILFPGRDRKKVREQLNRIFRILENKDLIEPNPIDNRKYAIRLLNKHQCRLSRL